MQSLTYKDIIDDKITDWRSELVKLDDMAAKASTDTKIKLSRKIEVLKSAIDSAIVELRKLDEHETVENTVETKNNILKIFTSIDKDFEGMGEVTTPFML